MKEFSLIMNKRLSSNRLSKNKYKPLSISVAMLLSACTSHAPAPIESTTIISSQQQSSQQHAGQYTQPNNPQVSRSRSSFNGYICEDAPTYIGKSIGDGECVDLIKLCSNAPLTRYWKPGDYAFGQDLPAGTAIATFRKGKYPNKSGYHAAIYSHQDENGIYAWDQWQGQAVHLRYIRARQKNRDAGNDASRYRVIRQH